MPMTADQIKQLILDINEDGSANRLAQKSAFLQKLQASLDAIKAKAVAEKPGALHLGTSPYSAREALCREEANKLTDVLLSDDKNVLAKYGIDRKELEAGLFEMIQGYDNDTIHLARADEARKALEEARKAERDATIALEQTLPAQIRAAGYTDINDLNDFLSEPSNRIDDWLAWGKDRKDFSNESTADVNMFIRVQRAVDLQKAYSDAESVLSTQPMLDKTTRFARATAKAANVYVYPRDPAGRHLTLQVSEAEKKLSAVATRAAIVVTGMPAIKDAIDLAVPAIANPAQAATPALTIEQIVTKAADYAKNMRKAAEADPNDIAKHTVASVAEVMAEAARTARDKIPAANRTDTASIAKVRESARAAGVAYAAQVVSPGARHILEVIEAAVNEGKNPSEIERVAENAALEIVRRSQNDRTNLSLARSALAARVVSAATRTAHAANRAITPASLLIEASEAAINDFYQTAAQSATAAEGLMLTALSPANHFTDVNAILEAVDLVVTNAATIAANNGTLQDERQHLDAQIIAAQIKAYATTTPAPTLDAVVSRARLITRNFVLQQSQAPQRQIESDLSKVYDELSVRTPRSPFSHGDFTEFRQALGDKLKTLELAAAGYPPKAMANYYADRKEQLIHYGATLKEAISRVDAIVKLYSPTQNASALSVQERTQLLSALNGYKLSMQQELDNVNAVLKNIETSPQSVIDAFNAKYPETDGNSPTARLADILTAFDDDDQALASAREELATLNQEVFLYYYYDLQNPQQPPAGIDVKAVQNYYTKTRTQQEGVLDQLSAGITQLINAIDSKNKELVKFKTEEGSLDKDLQKLTGELRQLESELLTTPVAQRAAKQAEIDTKERQLNTKHQELTNKQTDIARLETEIEQTKNNLSGAEAQKTRTHADLTETKRIENFYQRHFKTDIHGMFVAGEQVKRRITELEDIIFARAAKQATQHQDRRELQAVIALLNPAALDHSGLRAAEDHLKAIEQSLSTNPAQLQRVQSGMVPTQQLQQHLDYMAQETIPFGDKKAMDDRDTALADPASGRIATDWAQKENEFGFSGKKVHSDEWRHGTLQDPNKSTHTQGKITAANAASDTDRIAVGLRDGERILYQKEYPAVTKQGQQSTLDPSKPSKGSFSEDHTTVYDHSSNLDKEAQAETAMSMAMNLAQKWLRDPTGLIKLQGPVGATKHNSVPSDMVHAALLVIKHSHDAFKDMKIMVAPGTGPDVDNSKAWTKAGKIKDAEDTFITEKFGGVASIARLKKIVKDSMSKVAEKTAAHFSADSKLPSIFNTRAYRKATKEEREAVQAKVVEGKRMDDLDKDESYQPR